MKKENDWTEPKDKINTTQETRKNNSIIAEREKKISND